MLRAESHRRRSCQRHDAASPAYTGAECSAIAAPR
jgi:hypothetical protein